AGGAGAWTFPRRWDRSERRSPLFQRGATGREGRRRRARTSSRRGTPRSRRSLLQFAPDERIHQRRIRFTTHGLDDLADQKSVGLFLPRPVLLDGVAVCGKHLL